jgi:hypothetical protein
MRRSEVLTGMGISLAASMVAMPVVELATEIPLGYNRPAEVFGGAAMASAFFGISSLVAYVFQYSPYLRISLLMAYPLKIILLFVAAQRIYVDTDGGRVLALSIAVSAAAYILFQTIYIARWRRAWWLRRTSSGIG